MARWGELGAGSAMCASGVRGAVGRRGPGALAMVGAGVAVSLTLGAQAEDLAVFKLVARDGVFEPLKIEVPAGKRFKIEISNEGKGPMEFESRDLKREKVLAAGAK